jgi:hypothetical protein
MRFLKDSLTMRQPITLVDQIRCAICSKSFTQSLSSLPRLYWRRRPAYSTRSFARATYQTLRARSGTEPTAEKLRNLYQIKSQMRFASPEVFKMRFERSTLRVHCSSNTRDSTTRAGYSSRFAAVDGVGRPYQFWTGYDTTPRFRVSH